MLKKDRGIYERAYGVIVPLGISDNNSDNGVGNNEKQDENLSSRIRQCIFIFVFKFSMLLIISVI